MAARRLLGSGRYDVLVALGAVIRGDTPHFDYVAGEALSLIHIFSLIGEYGRISGGKIATYNTFGTTRADDALEYASVGIRLRF